MYISFMYGRAMAQEINRCLLTAEARVRARVSPCEICDGRSGKGTGFSTPSSVFPSQYHSTVDLHAHISYGVNNRSIGGRSSETQSHLVDMNNTQLRASSS
jgi:hypothetical protein